MSPAHTPATEPAAELPQEVFDDAARNLAKSLREYNAAFLVFEPGDATRYEILMAARGRGIYSFASSFGVLAKWGPNNSDYTSPDYCLEHFVVDRTGVWTAHVYARLLNTLRPLLSL